MARSPSASARCGRLAGDGGHRERGRLGDQRRDLGVLLLVAGLQRGDLRAELRGHRNRRRRWPRTSPGAGCPTAPRAHAPGIPGTPSSRRGPRPRTRRRTRTPRRARGPRRTTSPRGWPRTGEASRRPPALLLAQVGLVRRPVDVEDHGLLLLLVTGAFRAPRSPAGWSWQPWAMGRA